VHNHYRHEYNHRRARALTLIGGAALVVFLIALFSLVQTDTDDHAPRCPVTRAGGYDMVPSGIRPCLLYGTSSAVSGSGYNSHTGTAPHTGSTSLPHSSAKTPAAPKAPARKVPSAPKAAAPKPAPAPKAPAAPKVLSPRR
jgi:hypothetical protein